MLCFDFGVSFSEMKYHSKKKTWEFNFHYVKSNSYIIKINTLCIMFYFNEFLYHDNKKIQCEMFNGVLFFEKIYKGHHILMKTNKKPPYSNNEFFKVTKTNYDLKHLYFVNWSPTKFGSFLLWMINSPPIWIM
jgi:hypothetical protein